MEINKEIAYLFCWKKELFLVFTSVEEIENDSLGLT